MSNSQMQYGRITSRFQMQDLPPEVAKVVDTMKVGQISKSFQMINQKGKWVVDKIKGVYTRLNDNYRDCKFEYEGWIK